MIIEQITKSCDWCLIFSAVWQMNVDWSSARCVQLCIWKGFNEALWHFLNRFLLNMWNQHGHTHCEQCKVIKLHYITECSSPLLIIVVFYGKNKWYSDVLPDFFLPCFGVMLLSLKRSAALFSSQTSNSRMHCVFHPGFHLLKYSWDLCASFWLGHILLHFKWYWWRVQINNNALLFFKQVAV